jgi:NAD(P)-dependent dehydrogenase (short-subunit alcohol dehydrogenase family)
MDEDFAGKNALVVGGSSGIGAAVAKLLLQRGAATVLIVGKNPDKLKTAEAELRPFGRLSTEAADITDPAQLQQLLSTIGDKYSTVELLVNSAGVFLPKPFLEHTTEDYDRYLDLNKASFFITQRVAQNMMKRGKGGAIVNIGSMWARQSVQATPSSAYSMAKAGLHSLTQHLAMWWRHQSIRPSFPKRKCTRCCRDSTAFIPSDA